MSENLIFSFPLFEMCKILYGLIHSECLCNATKTTSCCCYKTWFWLNAEFCFIVISNVSSIFNFNYAVTIQHWRTIVGELLFINQVQFELIREFRNCTFSTVLVLYKTCVSCFLNIHASLLLLYNIYQYIYILV